MNKHTNPQTVNQSKDTIYHKQMQIVFNAFQQRPATMLMISKETGILRANICRYVSKFRKRDKIKLMYKTICPITKHRAGFYTTEISMFNNSKI